TALGLQHLSEHGLVHRDLKPSNILIDLSGDKRGAPEAMPSLPGTVKILDLGLAHLTDPAGGAERPGTIIGTPDFTAPEQHVDPHSVDIRADLYSLGCTLYFLLTGRTPFEGGSAAQTIARHRTTDPQPVTSLRPEVSPAVAAIVKRLMARRPDDRYQTAAEVAVVLGEVVLDSQRTDQP